MVIDMMIDMSIREHMALTIAAGHYRREGMRATDAREVVGVSITRLWQMVDGLLEREDALAERPADVLRLRRMRDANRAARASRRA